MTKSKLRFWIKGLFFLILLGCFCLFLFVKWFDHPATRVNMVTNIGLPFWSTDVVYEDDQSNPFGSATQFVFEVEKEAYRKSLEYCRATNSYDRLEKFSKSYQKLLKEVMPEAWSDDNLKTSVDCSFSIKNERVFWRISLKAPYVFYTFASN